MPRADGEGGSSTRLREPLQQRERECEQQAPATNQLLPNWWLFCLPLYWFPQSLSWTLIETYLLPFQVASVAGDAHKHIALSLMVVTSNIGGLAAPVLGSLSDKAVDGDGRRRRRPFVVVGQILFGCAVLFMAEARSVLMFLLAYLLYTLTASVSGPPYAAILTELVPIEQRGTYGGYWNWQGLVAILAGGGLGALVGQKIVSTWGAYMLAIGFSLFAIWPGLVGLGERPGCWAAEPFPPAPAAAAAAAGNHDTGNSIRRVAADFGSAFAHPPFRWLFLTTALNACYSLVCSIFYAYWFQDEIAPNFTVMGHLVTTHTQTALALASTISNVVSFFFVLPSGWLADHHDRCTILCLSSLVQTASPLLNGLYPSFSVICVTAVINGVCGGISSGAGRSSYEAFSGHLAVIVS
eukprot:COSAG05_NODE_950_length_6467_cov_231.083857_8_plen_410_part_00